MGIVIHYSGNFDRTTSIGDMIEEVKDIATIFNWDYHIYERAFPDTPTPATPDSDLYGISLAPPGCEALYFSFLDNGQLCGPGSLLMVNDPEFLGYTGGVPMVFTKTQFAGVEVHIKIINLLKYISGKYFSDIRVQDDGEYWETGDEKKLNESFARHSFLINSFEKALEETKRNKGETLEEYFERILRDFKL